MVVSIPFWSRDISAFWLQSAVLRRISCSSPTIPITSLQKTHVELTVVKCRVLGVAVTPHYLCSRFWRYGWSLLWLNPALFYLPTVLFQSQLPLLFDNLRVRTGCLLHTLPSFLMTLDSWSRRRPIHHRVSCLLLLPLLTPSIA